MFGILRLDAGLKASSTRSLRKRRTDRKWKRLRLWLCSSRRLLRGSPQRGCMHRRSLLMRSPLSRFQTPADTSQCSRFFRVWRLFRSPGPNRPLSVLRSGDAKLPSFSAADGSCCFGYAPAASSCERADCVEACTASASLRSPLSRFQTPANTSQCSRFFRVWRLRPVARIEPITRLTSDQLRFVAVLFCLRRKPIYRTITKCQRPRFVQSQQIFV